MRYYQLAQDKGKGQRIAYSHDEVGCARCDEYHTHITSLAARPITTIAVYAGCKHSGGKRAVIHHAVACGPCLQA